MQRIKELDGIFCGGGSLGIAYAGALRAVCDNGFWFRRVAGTSAGAMVAALIAAGYDAAEIDWLTAPSDTTIERPGSLPASVTEPVDLSRFLDYPESSSDIDPTIMRNTFLWKAIKLNAVDEILNRKLTALPTREKLLDDLSSKIVAISFGGLGHFQDRIKVVLKTALHFYPDDTPTIGSFVLIKLEHLREEIADAAWKAFTDTVRDYRLFVNWTFEGGFFKGQVLYETIKSLLEAKIWESRGLPIRPVLFNDLPLELGVISVNTAHIEHAEQMLVMTKLTAGDMEVAVAVQASMSVPLFFEPRKYIKEGDICELMDGGIVSNFPFWLFTGGHEGYFQPSADDNARSKIGFILNQDLDAPSDWGCPEPKWHVPDSTEGLSPNHLEALAENPEFTFLKWRGRIGEFRGIERVLKVVEVWLSSEMMLTHSWRSSVKATYPYYEVQIPLMGYHMFDFSVNKDVKTWRGMVDRGYTATVAALIDARLIAGEAVKRNPYRI